MSQFHDWPRITTSFLIKFLNFQEIIISTSYFYRIKIVRAMWHTFDILALRILTGKEHPQIKLLRLRKVWIWTFWLLIHQIKSLQEVFKLKQNFQKNEAVTGKTPFFVIGPFCTPHSIWLNIAFWQGSFVWKCCVFNLSTLN